MSGEELQDERKRLWERLLLSDAQNAVIRLPAEYRLKQWNPVRTLGEGAFGEVRLLVDSTDPKNVVAVKCINACVSGTEDEFFRKLRREALIMRVARQSEYVIDYFGMRFDQGQIQIFLEYADGGELFEFIEPERGMGKWKTQRFFRQLIAGVKFLHGKGIAHRDIKPENLLLTRNASSCQIVLDKLKICDFGLATIFRHRGTERRLKSKCGTVQYVSPQVLLGDYRGEPADIWSCGVVLVTMISGELPWEEPVRSSRAYRYWTEGLEWRYVTPWERLDGSTLGLLRKMLEENENRRITIADIEEHEFFVEEVAGGPDPDSATALSKPSDIPPLSESQINVPDSDKLNEPLKSVAEEGMLQQKLEDEEPHQKKRKLSVVSDTIEFSKADILGGPVSQPNTAFGISQASVREPRLDPITGNFFSQPVGVELLTQIDYSTNQHPLALLARRMTRFCVTKRAEETMLLIKERLDFKYTCVQRALNIMSVSGPRNRMSFVITIYEMMGNEGRRVMVDCRRSRGDGIEFKKAFLSLREKLSDLVCVTGNNWLEKQGLISKH